jgi:hypothetical protein
MIHVAILGCMIACARDRNTLASSVQPNDGPGRSTGAMHLKTDSDAAFALPTPTHRRESAGNPIRWDVRRTPATAAIVQRPDHALGKVIAAPVFRGQNYLVVSQCAE